MSEAGDFRRLQRAFAAHLRHPDLNAAPEHLEDRRVAIYRRLFFNSVRNLLASNYRVIRRIYGDDGFNAMVRDFYHRHPARSPLFPQLPREFLYYINHMRSDFDDPDWLPELADYEWQELSLDFDDVEDLPTPADNLDIALTGLRRSPAARLLIYRYPVHRISPSFQPKQAPDQPTALVAYRNAELRVKFTELNMVTARLLELLGATPGITGQQLLTTLAEELRQPVDSLLAPGLQMLGDLVDKRIVGVA